MGCIAPCNIVVLVNRHLTMCKHDWIDEFYYFVIIYNAIVSYFHTPTFKYIFTHKIFIYNILMNECNVDSRANDKIANNTSVITSYWPK